MGLLTPTEAPVQPSTEPAKTPLPEIVEALRRVSALQGLCDAELEWLATNSEEVSFPAGTTIFREGEPAVKLWIILRGEVHVRRQQGGLALFVARAGQISGLLPFSRMKTHGGQGVASSDVWGLQLDREAFPGMLQAIPALRQCAAGPGARDDAAGAAVGEAERAGKTGRESGARAQQSCVGGAARRFGND
jgi:hypothetical protein